MNDSFLLQFQMALKKSLSWFPLLLAIVLPLAVFEGFSELWIEQFEFYQRLFVVLLQFGLNLFIHGVLLILVDQALKDPSQPAQVLAAFHRISSRFWDLFWIETQFSVGCLWRSLLLIVPGAVYAAKFCFAPIYAAIEPEIEGFEAFETSERLTREVRVPLFFWMVAFLLPPFALTIQKTFFGAKFSLLLYLGLSIPLNALLSVVWSVFMVAIYRKRQSDLAAALN